MGLVNKSTTPNHFKAAKSPKVDKKWVKLAGKWGMSPLMLSKDSKLQSLISKMENFQAFKALGFRFVEKRNGNLYLFFGNKKKYSWKKISRKYQPKELMFTDKGLRLNTGAFLHRSPKNLAGKYFVQVVTRHDSAPFPHSIIRLIDKTGRVYSYGAYPVNRAGSPLTKFRAIEGEIATIDPVEFELRKAKKISMHTYSIDKRQFKSLRSRVRKSIQKPQKYSVLSRLGGINCAAWARGIMREVVKDLQEDAPNYIRIVKDTPAGLAEQLSKLPHTHYTENPDEIALF